MGAVGGSALSPVIFMPGDVSSPLADRLEGRPVSTYSSRTMHLQKQTQQRCVPSLQVSGWTGVSLRAAEKKIHPSPSVCERFDI